MSILSLKFKKSETASEYNELPPTPRGIFSHELSEFSGGRMRPKACVEKCVNSAFENLAQRDLDLSKKDARIPITEYVTSFKNTLNEHCKHYKPKSDVIKLRGEFQNQLFSKLGEQWAERMSTSFMSLPLPSSDAQKMSKETNQWVRQFINGSIYLYNNRKDYKECQPFLEAIVDKTAEAFKSHVSDARKSDEKERAHLLNDSSEQAKCLDGTDIDQRVEYMKKCVSATFNAHIERMEAKRAKSVQDASPQAGEKV